jgi:ferredoxin-type protein NapG
MPDDRRVNRRRFFRDSLRELLRPISETLEKAANDLGATESAKRIVPLAIWLRPPGALPESQFLETCSMCAACVRVCPVQCIKIDTSGNMGGNKGDGAPFIDPDSTACAVCDGLYCMPACPSGALQITPLNQIDMGTAVWHSESCVRSRGEDCTICIDHCPIGTFAIESKGNDVLVHETGCIGCGVCQHDCPTNPKSITVMAKRG